MSSYPFDQSFQPEPPAGGPQIGGPPLVQQLPEVEQMAATPAVDVFDNTDEIHVFLDVPGFTEEEMRLSGDETTLLVTAERIEETEEGRHVVVQERPRRLQRTVPLPAPVDVSEAAASYEDGVCKITLPKTAAQRYEDIAFRSD